MRLRYISLIYMCFLSFLCACEQGQSTAVLEIYVLDPLGNRVVGATVNIYRFREDWEQEKNPTKTAEITNETGLIRFVNLEAGTYYVDVVKNGLNNWEGKVETTVQSVGAFFVNTEFIIMNNSKSGDVATAQGKSWRVIAIEQSGRSTPVDKIDDSFRCRFDNVITFYKGGRYDLKKGVGTKCNPNDAPLVGSGTWKFNETGTVITLQAMGQPALTWTVLKSSSTNLTFRDAIITPFGVISTDIIFVLN